MPRRIRDDGRSHRNRRTFDSHDRQHFVCGSFRFTGGGPWHDNVSGGFVGDVFCVLTQHRQTKELNPGENQHEENRKYESKFHHLRAGSGRALPHYLTRIFRKGSHGVTP
jgi:hypothetical protein